MSMGMIMLLYGMYNQQGVIGSGDFELLSGEDFFLLDGTNFLLLGV